MSNGSLFHRTNKLTISVRQPMHRPFLWNNRGPVNDLGDLKPRQHIVKPVAILRFITTLVCYSAHARTKAVAGSCEQEWGALLNLKGPCSDCRYVAESFRSSQRTSCLLRLCAEFRRWQPGLPCTVLASLRTRSPPLSDPGCKRTRHE